jgi:hypothetical protein
VNNLTPVRRYKRSYAAFPATLGVLLVIYSSFVEARTPGVDLQISQPTTGLLKVWTLNEIEAQPQRRIVTSSPYFSGTATFDGPLMADLLTATLGAEPKASTTIKLVALNNYVVETTFSKLKNYDAIMATKKNDSRMLIRERGPLWVILPLTDRPNLDSADFHRLIIWQLSDIIVGESQ